MARNPVMFVVEVGSVLTTVLFVRDVGDSTGEENLFAGLVAVWLWFTVLFANFAEAVAEGRGKAQADTLRQARTETSARRRDRRPAIVEEVPAPQLAGRRPRGGRPPARSSPATATSSRASPRVDESAITGESAPVIRESGGDRSRGHRRHDACCPTGSSCGSPPSPGETFLDRMIALVEGAERQKTPNEIALNILLAGLTIIFLLAVVTLQPFAIYSGAEQAVIVLVALLVCLIPTTIGALLSAIGIAGMDRLVQRNVLAMSRPRRRGRRRRATPCCSTRPAPSPSATARRPSSSRSPGVDRATSWPTAAQLASLADETPEGRSIVVLGQGALRPARTATSSPATRRSSRSPPRPA